MEVQAISRNIRISPRKVRIVANLIRGKKAGEAISILHNTPKAASKIIEKCLRSAMANAENNNNMNIDNLYISTIFVDARDQVLMIFCSLVSFSALIFFSREKATNGPFFTDLDNFTPPYLTYVS